MDDDDAFEPEPPKPKPTPVKSIMAGAVSPSVIPPPPAVTIVRPPAITAPGASGIASTPPAKKPRVRKPKAPAAEGAQGAEGGAEGGEAPKAKKPRQRKSPAKKKEGAEGSAEAKEEGTEAPPEATKTEKKATGTDSAAAGTEKAPRKRKAPSGSKAKTPDDKEGTGEQATPEKPKRRKGKVDEDVPEAFLKLDCMELGQPGVKEGKRFVRYVTHLPSTLGRSITGASKPPATFIGLSESATIGREHAIISFNNDTGNYELLLTGKNGALVRGEKYEGVEGLETGTPIPLKPKDPVKIGDVGFYICMPEMDKPKKSYADLSVEALEEKKIHGILQMSSRDIALYVIEKYPYYNLVYGNVEKLHLLAKAVQSAISKCEKIVSVPTGVRGRVMYALGVRILKQPTKPAGAGTGTDAEGKQPQAATSSPTVSSQ